MYTVQIQQEDLVKLRFAYSPMADLASSFKILQDPEFHGYFKEWVEEAQMALRGLELPYMEAVILPYHYMADFITPTPLAPVRDIEDEWHVIAGTPAEIIVDNIQHILSISENRTPAIDHFLTDPCTALDLLLREFREYWNRTLAHHWSSMVSVLEGDILYRGRQFALQGVEALIKDISGILEYRESELIIHKDYRSMDGCDLRLRGQGLQLVPSIFQAVKDSVAWQIQPHWQPMIMYGARGGGLWYQPPQPGFDDSLELMIGSGKAMLLQALLNPTNTGELARQLHMTAGAISQHLGRLSQAGLVESQRSGNRVYYRLSHRGERLLEVFTL